MTRAREFLVTGSATVVIPGIKGFDHEFRYTVHALDVSGVLGCTRPIIEEDACEAAGVLPGDYRVIITKFLLREVNHNDTNNNDPNQRPGESGRAQNANPAGAEAAAGESDSQ